MTFDYKAIIFDWDGTLVDTCGLILDAHNHVRSYMGEKPWTMDDFMGRPSQSAREYYPKIYGNRSDEAQKILYAYVEEHHLTYLKPMKFSEEVLTFIDEKKIPIGIVSNKRHDTLKTEIKAMGWEQYFQSVVGAGHAEKDKPSPDPLLLAIRKINASISPDDILYIGDTETDLLCAQNAKCPVALVQTEKPRPDLVEKYAPLHVWNDLSPLKELIASELPKMAVNKA